MGTEMAAAVLLAVDARSPVISAPIRRTRRGSACRAGGIAGVRLAPGGYRQGGDPRFAWAMDRSEAALDGVTEPGRLRCPLPLLPGPSLRGRLFGRGAY